MRCGFDPWLGKNPWRRKCQPTLVFLPEESHGQRSVVGYIQSISCKGLDTTNTHCNLHTKNTWQMRTGLRVTELMIFCWTTARFLNLSIIDILIQFSSVAQSCLTLCDPMNFSMPALFVYHQLPEFAQTHVHWVDDAIQPSHPLLPPSPLALNLSQRQGLFQGVNSLHPMDCSTLGFPVLHYLLEFA